MKEIARQLVNKLLESEEKEYHIVYNITNQKGEPTGKKVMVLVVNTTPEKIESLKEFAIHKAVAGPKGEPCPHCNGTGRIL